MHPNDTTAHNSIIDLGAFIVLISSLQGSAETSNIELYHQQNEIYGNLIKSASTIKQFQCIVFKCVTRIGISNLFTKTTDEPGHVEYILLC